MPTIPWYQRSPWSIPVPVRPSHLVAMAPEHQKFNIQVDLAQLAPFAYATGQPEDSEFLYADLQSSPIFSIGLRLGSGRAGFYQGKYLKGVGRTQLAGNWRNQDDVYHGTGHLMASAAVREYIVSCYLRAKGAQHTIVPCEGLLLGPLHKDLQGYEQAAFPGEQLCPIDLKFQAISIKDSEFARYSNFVWAFNHLSRRGRYGKLFSSLYYYLTVGRKCSPVANIGPADIVSVLSACARQGLLYYSTFLSTGVYWGSFGNNFTLDGRFLDLEVPLIFGGPFVGLVKREHEMQGDLRRTAAPVVGCEALEYLIQVRFFIKYLIRRLHFILDTCSVVHPIEKEFVAEFLAALEAEFSEEHVIMSKSLAVESILKLILDNVIGAAEHADSLRRIVQEQYESYFHHRPADLSAFNFRRLPLQLAKSESFLQYYAFYPDFLAMDSRRDEVEHINRALDRLDQSTSLDSLMQGIEQLASEIGR